MSYSLGVDLGTTYTAAAIAREGRAEIVPLGSHAAQIPSVLWLREDGGFLVGDAAVRRGATEPTRLAREFKRRLGDKTPIFLGGTPTSAHVLMGKLLSFVVGDVAEHQGEPPGKLVVSCPANWGPFRRELLENAIRVADVGPAEICTEPEAAAIHFSSTERVTAGDVLAIYDLGGGTFDAAVMQRTGTGFELLGSPEGIEQLGGIDFDESIFYHVMQAMEAAAPELQLGDPDLAAARSRLRRECVEAKEALSTDTVVTIPVAIPGAPATVRVNRSEFEDMIRQPLSETVASLRRTIASAGVGVEDITAVVLVGGSARIPLIRELLQASLGRPLSPSPQPKHCVALGAALGSAVDHGETPSRHRAGTLPPAEQPEEAPTTGGPPDPPPMEPDPEPMAPPRSTPAAAPSREAVASPARGGRRAAIAGVVLAVLAGLLAFLTPGVSETTILGYEGDVTTPYTGTLKSTAKLAPRLVGVTLGEAPQVDDTKTFNMQAGKFRLLIAGAVRADLDSDTVLVKAPTQFGARAATIPGVASVLAFLFAIAYAESMLRPVRRRRRAKLGEVVGMIGVGLVAGLALVLAAWILRNELLPVWASVGIVLLMSAAAACLTSAVANRQVVG